MGKTAKRARRAVSSAILSLIYNSRSRKFFKDGADAIFRVGAIWRSRRIGEGAAFGTDAAFEGNASFG